jgi:hypothetical protein
MTTADSYTPDNHAAIPPPFSETIPAFFRAWDNPESKDEDWIDFFSPECSVKFGGHVSQSYEALREMRAGFIHPLKGPVINLQHNLKTCWALAGGSEPGTEAFILKASIWYQLANGRKVDAECISYIKLADKGHGSWQAIEYEVFLSSFEIMDAVRDLNADSMKS